MNFRIRAVTIAASVAALLVVSPAQADTFKVSTTKDQSSNKCPKKKGCSFREAIMAASAKPNKSTVVVPKGNYKLKKGEVTLGGGSLKVKGAGARKTKIASDGTSRVLEITGGPTSLSKLTITGGNALLGNGEENMPGDGGGILVVSSTPLTISDSAITRNKGDMSGGGIAAPIENMMATKVTIRRSSITKNIVADGMGDGSGGGVFVAGDLTLDNSTVAQNSLQNATMINRGGGVSVMPNPMAPGGTTTFKLMSSTIANNTIAGDAMDGMGGGLGLTDPMMGAMVDIEATNSIIAQNKVLGATEDCGMLMMGLVSNRNLSSDASCMFDDADSFPNTNPKFGKLGLNGGQTESLAPKKSSDAIDNGPASCGSKDQRGVKRPQGNRCDLGSVELKR